MAMYDNGLRDTLGLLDRARIDIVDAFFNFRLDERFKAKLLRIRALIENNPRHNVLIAPRHIASADPMAVYWLVLSYLIGDDCDMVILGSEEHILNPFIKILSLTFGFKVMPVHRKEVQESGEMAATKYYRDLLSELKVERSRRLVLVAFPDGMRILDEGKLASPELRTGARSMLGAMGDSIVLPLDLYYEESYVARSINRGRTLVVGGGDALLYDSYAQGIVYPGRGCLFRVDLDDPLEFQFCGSERDVVVELARFYSGYVRAFPNRPMPQDREG